MFGLNGWEDNGRVVTETFEANPWTALFDSADSNQKVAYDYSETINYVGGFGQVEYSVNEFSAFLQGSLSTQSYQRHGGRDFYQASEKVDKSGYNVRLAAGTIIAKMAHTRCLQTEAYTQDNRS